MPSIGTIVSLAFFGTVVYVVVSLLLARRPTEAQRAAARAEFDTLHARLDTQLKMLEPVLDRVPADSPVIQLYRKAMMYFDGSGNGPLRVISIFERVRDMKQGLALIDEIRASDDYKKLRQH